MLPVLSGVPSPYSGRIRVWRVGSAMLRSAVVTSSRAEAAVVLTSVIGITRIDSRSRSTPRPSGCPHLDEVRSLWWPEDALSLPGACAARSAALNCSYCFPIPVF